MVRARILKFYIKHKHEKQVDPYFFVFSSGFSLQSYSPFLPRHTIVAGYYGFKLVVRASVPVSIHRPSVRFSFLDDNLSKHQCVFTKLDMCIDIVEIWFGIANGQISSIFDGVISPRHAHIFVSG